MNDDANKIAEYLGRIIAILQCMQDKYPSFTHLFSFNIFMEGDSMVSAAHLSDDLSDGELRDLQDNVNNLFLQKNPSGIEFSKELEEILRKLEIDLDNEGPRYN